MAHGKVYCFGPTFRAEKSKTRRHLTEFWMVEPEIAYASLDDVIEVAEDFVCSIVQRVLNDHRSDLEELGRDVSDLEKIQKPFYRLKYMDAAELLRGPKAKELLENDLKEKTAAIETLKKEIVELEEQAQSAKKTVAKGQSRSAGNRQPRTACRARGTGHEYPQAHGAGRQLPGWYRPRRIR